MTNPFVTTEIKTVTTINWTKNGKLSNYADFTILGDGNDVELVVGAKHKDAVCNSFDKQSLLELAQILKEIAEAMPK